MKQERIFERFSQDWIIGEFYHYSCYCGVGKDDAPDFTLRALVIFVPTEENEYALVEGLFDFLHGIKEQFTDLPSNIYYSGDRTSSKPEFLPRTIRRAIEHFQNNFSIDPNVFEDLFEHLLTSIGSNWLKGRILMQIIILEDVEDRGSRRSVINRFTRYYLPPYLHKLLHQINHYSANN